MHVEISDSIYHYILKPIYYFLVYDVETGEEKEMFSFVSCTIIYVLNIAFAYHREFIVIIIVHFELSKLIHHFYPYLV